MKDYIFTKGLSHLIHNTNEETKNELFRRLDYYIETYTEMLKENKDEKYRVIFSFLKLMDESIKSEIGKYKSTCKKSCSFCCSINVDITETEKELLDYVVKNKKIKLNEEIINKQSSKNDKTWSELNYLEKKCVFLKDNKCSIYEYRPINCRKYYVVSEPELCDTVKYPMQIVSIVNIPDSEIIASAIFTVEKYVKNIASFLKK